MSEKDLSVPMHNDRLNRNQLLPEQTFLPDAYRLPEGQERAPVVPFSPGVVFIEVTNRCNLLCQTCPRTHFEREPSKSLTLDEFIHIAEQFPHMRQAELHGAGARENNQIGFRGLAQKREVLGLGDRQFLAQIIERGQDDRLQP